LISRSIQSKPTYTNSENERRQQLKQWYEHCRAGTLALFEQCDHETFCHQAHPDFSPIGWHLGHIGFTESLWLLELCAGLPSIFSPEYKRLFAANGLPKTERVKLPTLGETYQLLNSVRTQVLDYLEIAPLDEQERLWRFILQHECQHSETIILLSQLQKKSESLSRRPSQFPSPKSTEMIEIPAGEFEQGNNAIDALDNERPAHKVYLDTYWIDRYPVTCGQYREFIQAGGYQNLKWWSAAGWKWLQANPVTQPLYWIDESAIENHPVCGVSWYEADAYARFIGKRLPTEAEWEKAARWNPATGKCSTYPWGEEQPNAHQCNQFYINPIQNQTTPVNAYPAAQSACGCYDMLGNVWEWTASWFNGYQGFISYPYPGYSQTYFDGKHRVLKGGSWATRPWSMRCSFRNWYYPSVREILAGFRCVSH
jgi:gamma-glutamyl hercynylcysteine S-oxide synthase